MRPLELRIRNFRSYFGDDAVFDFRDRRLVGVVGPIGAGKSSILDAMSFALYGKTPMVAANTKSLIHQRSDGALVALRFVVDGEVWEAVRALRRRGQSQHSLSRLAADEPDAEVHDKLVLEADVNARVVELLGLEFDAFTRSVLLAQGRFSEFLRARPAERDGVLKGVFGLDRIDAMRLAAKTRAGEASASLEALSARLEQLERTASRLAERQGERADVEDRIEAIRKSEPAHGDLEARIAAIGARSAEIDERLIVLDGMSAAMPDPPATGAVVAEAVSAGAARAELAAALETAQQELAAAEEALTAAEADGIAARVEEAAELLAAREPAQRRLDELHERVGGLEAKAASEAAAAAAAEAALVEAEKGAAAAGAAVEAAAERLRAAEGALHEAQHADMAATLRAGLAADAPCPVCEQPVAVVPDSVPGSALGELEEAAGAARSATASAEQARASAIAALEGARARLEATIRSREAIATELEASAVSTAAAREELEALAARLTVILGTGDPVEQLGSLRTRLGGVTEAVAQARRNVDRARRDHDEAIRRQQAAGKELGGITMALVELSARLGSEPPSIDDDDPDTVAAAAEALRSGWRDERAALGLERTTAAEALAAAERERDALLDALGLETDLPTALATLEARGDWLADEIRSDADEIAGLDALVVEREALEARRETFARLAADLTDARFVRFLLDEERARLADLGSDHFQRLSSGRYRFTEDGSFGIIDLTAAEAVRRADSLSGGETFLASLGLALALAEMVTRTGGRLDAFFLDEGFGTLDPEHLDLAMEGIELLSAGAGSRLVVVVSHVPELRQRLEDLIELDRSPVTGDTVVVRS